MVLWINDNSSYSYIEFAKVLYFSFTWSIQCRSIPSHSCCSLVSFTSFKSFINIFQSSVCRSGSGIFLSNSEKCSADWLSTYILRSINVFSAFRNLKKMRLCADCKQIESILLSSFLSMFSFLCRLFEVISSLIVLISISVCYLFLFVLVAQMTI